MDSRSDTDKRAAKWNERVDDWAEKWSAGKEKESRYKDLKLCGQEGIQTRGREREAALPVLGRQAFLLLGPTRFPYEK